MECLNANLSDIFIEGGWQRDNEFELVNCFQEGSYWIIVQPLQFLAVHLHHLHVRASVLSCGLIIRPPVVSLLLGIVLCGSDRLLE